MPEAEQGLEAYLVGGAVRDALLGREVTDRDWVIVGATPAEMTRRGFKQVGRDFPVFLHPVSHEEYALARTERKTRPGYQGFEFNASPEVTLEQDLARRDLTINAMAQTPDGEVIDYFGGREDLRRGILRHVSEAFVEDPVRLLRTARFSARYGFTIAPETLTLMKRMVDNGEVDALVPERVWQELAGALAEPQPSRFILALRECGALVRVFPEIDALFGIPQPKHYHPEVDTGTHTLMVVDQAARLSDDPLVLFAALVHDLGKALTPMEVLPRHYEHEQRGLGPIRRLCERLRVPRAHCEFAMVACRHHLLLHRLGDLKAKTVLQLLERIDAFRRPERVRQYALVCEADARGRGGRDRSDYPQSALLLRLFEAARGVNATAIARQLADGEAVAAELRRQREQAIAAVLREIPAGTTTW